MLNNLSAYELVSVIDSLRNRGRTWDSLDDVFGIPKGRTRRVYKSACSRLGIIDVHYYRHCKTY